LNSLNKNSNDNQYVIVLVSLKLFENEKEIIALAIVSFLELISSPRIAGVFLEGRVFFSYFRISMFCHQSLYKTRFFICC